jgi:gluconolactonase
MRSRPSRLKRSIATLIAITVGGDSYIRAADFRPTSQDTIVPTGAKMKLVWAEGTFTEGPAVAAYGAILFSDIGNRIMLYEPATGETTVFREPSGKSNGLMFNREGALIACEGGGEGGNRRVSISELISSTPADANEGKRRWQVRTLADRYDGKRFNSPNDLAIDASGRVYFTDPRYGDQAGRELDFEGVFLVDMQGKVALATRDVQKPNGILIAPDGQTVYVADNNSDAEGNHHLTAFRVQADGTLADKRILFDIGPNRRGIDGMAMDEKGNLYATAGSGELAGVYVFDPAGGHLAFIPTPGTPTNCEFGGPSEPTALYITAGVSEEEGQERRFGLYRIELAIAGHRVFPEPR